MPADIADHRAAFTGEREERNVWHMDGEYTGVDAKGKPIPFNSIDHAAEMGRILYDVYKRPLYLKEGTEVQNLFALCRNRWESDPVPNDKKKLSLKDRNQELGPVILGQCTTRYQIYQTKLALDTLRPLVESGLLNVTACGVLRNGAKVWVSAEIADGVVRKNPDGKRDKVQRHVLIMVGHDGKTANNLNVSDTRVVCANTLRVAEMKGVSFYFKHSNKSGELIFEEAKKGLAKMSNDFKEVMEQFKFLASVKLVSAEVDVFFEAMFGKGEDSGEGFGAKRSKQIQTITELFEGGGTGLGGGTWWDFYNAFTEQQDWKSVENPHTAKHLDSILFGSRATTRENALRIATEMAQKRTPTPALVTV